MNVKCQIFTPNDICEKILEIANYKNNLYGKKVLENSCGDGNILSKIVTRYIIDSINKGHSKMQIKKGIENDIYAFEIDGTHKENCIRILDNITREYDINNVKWNIYKKDYLHFNLKEKFDFIIGNPPYISYRDLDETTRKFVKEKFLSCEKGKFDYCYAFIEKSVRDLKENGTLTYIIPNSLFKNEFANELRQFILNDLVEIFDYRSFRVFPNALTSSAIIKLKKNVDSANLDYYDYSLKKKTSIQKSKLERKWVFDNKIITHKLKFQDLFDCSIAVATLLNEAFIISSYSEDEKYIYFGDSKVEKEITKKAISPRNQSYSIDEKIIFPYYYNHNTLCRYTELEFKNKFQNCYKYLLSKKNDLNQRTSDKSAKWYEFGRSQALAHLNREKLLISTVVTKKVKVYMLNEDEIPYSGIYIIPKGNNQLMLAKKILESKEFFDYTSIIGINTSGSSMRITPSDIKNFTFTEEDLVKWKN